MKDQVCLVPRLSGLGGMVSFQAKFIQELEARQIPYSFDLSDPANTVVLVIGGTRRLGQLWRAKRRGLRIFQRLNGMNWIHRLEKTPLKAALKAEINNLTLAFIRRTLADGIIYQSGFSRDWWDRVFQPLKIPASVAYNGIDLAQYSPEGQGVPPRDHYRILLVEGHLTGAYARGLETAVHLVETLQPRLEQPLELMVVGDASQVLISKFNNRRDLWITWGGILPRDEIPAVDRSAHVLFSTDLNAACPNSVIEALACGLPVLAYDTGSLAELVQDGAGRVVPFGADYWRLEEPQIEPLADACLEILQNNPVYREHARRRAVKTFSLDDMVDAYLDAMGVT